MHLCTCHQILNLFTVIIYLFAIATLAITASDVSSKKQEDSTNLGSSQRFNIPFIVLMSPNEISVVQLPLIEKGTLSVVFSINDSLTEGEFEREISEDDSVGDYYESSSSRTRAKTSTDAREYEQMPSSASLGKSEWLQQIANRNRNHTSQGHFKEVGEGKEEESTNETVASRNGKEINRPRRRSQRSISGYGRTRNSSIGSGGSNSLNSGHNNSSSNQHGPLAVMESSSLVKNVTSAPFRRRKREEDASSTSSSAEGDKAGTVQFCDFDVHMKFGYAFVADSMGRIHRFKLSGFEQPGKGNAKENSLRAEFDRANTIKSSSSSMPDNFNRGNNAPVSAWNKKLSRNLYNSVVNEVGDSVNSVAPSNGYRHNNNDAAAAAADDDDANKVNHTSASHEQLGQHPSASGNEHLGRRLELDSRRGSGSARDITSTSDLTNNMQNSNFILSDNEYTNDDLLIVTTGFDLEKRQPPYGVSSYGLLPQKLHPTKFNEANPRIIWSPTKHASLSSGAHLSKSSTTIGDSSSSQVKLNSTEGALSERSDSEDSKNHSNNQMVNETWHMASAEIVSGRLSDEVQAEFSRGGGDQTRGESVSASKPLPTEIAVDWLNNVLFVLDKHRLVLMDFEGNNELLLIDDFTEKNRPINLKVDPINSFLFWLQVGQFHNTIYKLDLNGLGERLISNSLKMNHSNRLAVEQAAGSELVALMSVHYAHPVITHLPKHVQIFIIDHKHSRIYVPLVSATSESVPDQHKKNQNDETEVFATSSESNSLTHMNHTSTLNQSDDSHLYEQDGLNCSGSDSNGEILAYNLDGTDVGPLRNGEEKSHLNDMKDITLDNERGFLYWLSRNGSHLSEEYDQRESGFLSAEHDLRSKSESWNEKQNYMKLMHFDSGSNQPRNREPRFKIRSLFQTLSPSLRETRFANPSEQPEESRYERNNTETSSSTHNTPLIILGMVVLIVISVYLLYTFIFNQVERIAEKVDDHSLEGSIGGSSLCDSNIANDSHNNGFNGDNTIARWIVKPSSQEAYTSSFNQASSENEHNRSFDFESSTYGNAIDEHYRDEANRRDAVADLDVDSLANLNGWPTNLLDMSNKLYVPVEVTQDEALASIHRISIDQLEIERRAPLGEGHFGTVLQGVITCTKNQKTAMLNGYQPHSTCSILLPTMAQSYITQRIIPESSSTSSGHGSSSTSSEFTTANNDSNADYLTPKSHCNSTVSDYNIEHPSSSIRDSCTIQNNHSKQVYEAESKLRVAIKKLKDNASAEEKRDFLQEAKLLAKFNHPNIVHLIGICLDRGSTLLVMELMLGGDLIRYMEENIPKPNNPDNLTHDDLLRICLDIVNGCCYLEELNHIHRDLAARNCLVSSRKKEDRVVKLADFGLARDIYKDSYYKKLNDSAMPLKWMAPECLTDQKFTIMSDVWSFGVVMWEVMSYCQEKPYGVVEPFFMRDHLVSGARLKKPSHCSDDVYRLMNQCWQFDPINRPTFNECRAALIEIKNRQEQGES